MNNLRDYWIKRYNILLAIGWLTILVAFSSEQMYEWALAGIVVTALLALLGLLKAGNDEDVESGNIDRIWIFSIALLATGIYWFRSWNGLPSQISLVPFFRVLTGFGFWWPGVLYASLFRYPDEGLKPNDRSRFNKTILSGFAGSIIGFISALILLQLL